MPHYAVSQLRIAIASALLIVTCIACGSTTNNNCPSTNDSESICFIGSEIPSLITTSPTTPAPPTPTTIPEPTPEIDGRDGGDAGEVGGHDRERYLSALYIGLNTDSSTGMARAGTFTTNGVEYPHSIATTAGCYNDDGGDMWADYDLGRSYSRLQMVVGLSDKANPNERVTWEIQADGQVIASSEAVLGQSQPVDLSVENILRIRLHMNEAGAPTRGCLEDKLYLIWGGAAVS